MEHWLACTQFWRAAPTEPGVVGRRICSFTGVVLTQIVHNLFHVKVEDVISLKMSTFLGLRDIIELPRPRAKPCRFRAPHFRRRTDARTKTVE